MSSSLVEPRSKFLRVDAQTGKISSICSADVFASIRSIATARLQGNTKDYIVVGSDSGRLAVLEYSEATSSFVKLNHETFGKSGTRRIVPGQFLAVDPKGRSVMIAAIEKSKLVYTLNRDTNANITISSPLEAHSPGTIVHHIVGLDVGFDNPMFAALEVDYTEADRDPTGSAAKNAKKMLTLYELDLGLNHVVRKSSEPTDPRANLLVQVPGGTGPSGILICCEDAIIYQPMNRGAPTPGPDSPSPGSLRVRPRPSGLGDLYKATLDFSDGVVHALKVKYFDTVSVSSSLCILKAGFLFVASEFGNHLGPQKAESPQILAACGRGFRSKLRILRHGLEVEDIVSCDVRSSPNGLWVIKRDEKASYVILSFANATLVFSIGEALVEVQDTAFLTFVPSLAVQQLDFGADSGVQVHPAEVRHILVTGEICEWAAPTGTTIVAAATNQRQIVVALDSAEIVYFELDLNGQLNEYQERRAMGSAILALGLAEVAEGQQRTPYLAVGCEDQTLRIFSLDPERTLDILSLQALSAVPSSALLKILEAWRMARTLSISACRMVFWCRRLLTQALGIWLIAGLGSSACAQFDYLVSSSEGARAMLTLSSRPWMNYTYNKQTRFTPLIYDEVQYACRFPHDLCSNGFAGIVGSELRIFRLPKIEEQLSQRSIPSSHTPRQIVSHPQSGLVYIAEGDHRAMGDAEISNSSGQLSGDDYIAVFGRSSAPAGKWSSCIRVVDPMKKPLYETTLAVHPLSENEAAFSVAIVPFAALNGELMLVVGTATDVFTADGGLDLYHVVRFSFLRWTKLFFNFSTWRLLAGIGKALQIYDIGKQKLLRKAENHSFATTIVTLNVQGSRIVVGDMQQSLLFVAYKEAPESRLIVVADDTQTRWTACSTMLEYTTAVAGDRFGNIFVNRLDSVVSDEVDRDFTGDDIMREKSQLNGAPHKTQMVAHFHVGDLVTCVHKVALVAGVREVILYTGLHGTMGVLVPLVAEQDVEFLSGLEQLI
ncbi:Pre-mRNA-splicing factor RSE1 [Mycena venus]|uniref:Pre-mRNA-splicing factor RSE1 n=1 Tax=Mycena venus TaxID=2733690 RepID=A0A8H6WUM5_9AGAR|nr:Pre-mRNA-splicing factor RSE1 [Mycena venus]